MSTGLRPRMFPLLALAGLALGGCAPQGDTDGHGDHGHGHAGAHAEAEFERGPHRGRMLRDGNFALEVEIIDTALAPQFRLHAFRDGQPLAPGEVRARVEVTRLGGRREAFEFTPVGAALAGNAPVHEPHSFDVQVTAESGGRTHRWQYASYEARTTIAADVARASGVVVGTAGPATIRSTTRLLGTVALDANRTARVRARFPGIVREVRVGPGDAVRQGQVLAIVEGNESMRSYPIVAPIAGQVMLRNTSVGDVTGDEALFEIADLSSVWVDLNAFGRDIGELRPGQVVTVRSAVTDETATGRIARILPFAVPGSQSAVARVSLANPVGTWRPGLAVSADVTLAEHQVPLAVRTLALQPFRALTVVYVAYGDTYEARVLQLGRGDADFTEVLGGLEPGTPYVTGQAFLIRADIEKSGAGHDH